MRMPWTRQRQPEDDGNWSIDCFFNSISQSFVVVIIMGWLKTRKIVKKQRQRLLCAGGLIWYRYEWYMDWSPSLRRGDDGVGEVGDWGKNQGWSITSDSSIRCRMTLRGERICHVWRGGCDDDAEIGSRLIHNFALTTTRSTTKAHLFRVRREKPTKKWQFTETTTLLDRKQWPSWDSLCGNN